MGGLYGLMSLPAQQTQRYNIPGRHLAALCLVLLGLFIAMLPATANAQITRTARVELSDQDNAINIGPNIYITEDPEKKLNYQAVVVRHQNNLRGMRHDSNIINLGLKATPTWLMFSVTNNSSTEDWILHFGTLPGGRLGFAHKLFIHNETTGKTLIRALRENKTPEAYGAPMEGPAIPVSITKGQTELFVIYIEAESAFANTLSPSLMTTRHYMETLRYGHLSMTLASFFFIGMIGFFIAVAFMNQNSEYLMFSAFYIINAGLMLLIDNNFFLGLQIGGELLAALYAMNIIIGLLITKFLLNVTIEDHTENIVIFATAAFIVVISLFNLTLYGESGALDELLLFVPVGFGLLILAGLSFVQGQRGKYAGHYFASGWLLGLAGHCISGLSSAEIISQSSFLLNAYWFFLLPQAAFFISGTVKKIRLNEEEQRHARARQSRAERSLARLQQSKETADQARLLRVIERERELMTELREREMQRTEEMRRAKEMADEANRAKSAFLAVVSHEIRTPMTGILGMVRLLNDTKLSRDQHDYLIAVQKSGDTMMALLNDILDFEKIQSGNMEIEAIDFDLPRLVQGVVTLMSGHAADKKIYLKADIPNDFSSYLVGDPTRLRQVLLNLVSNAIKFTHDGGVTIRLRATPVEKKSETAKEEFEVYFAVEDTGIGISEEAQLNLFSPFAQADKTVARKYGGTGLGLAICKSLVEAMGSAVRVTSEPRAGSTFFFSILMEKGREDVAEEIDSRKSAPHLPPMRILVIEDNEMNRRVIQGFLEKDGHTAVLSDSGEHAVEVARNQRFDAVFTDIGLGGMDGIQTTKTLRTIAENNTASLPVIAITGNVSAEDVKTYYAAGMNGFLPKPIDPEKLHNVLVKIHTGKLDNPVPEVVLPPEPEAQQPEPKPAASPHTESRAPIQEYLNTLANDLSDALIDDDDFDSFAEAESSFAAEAQKLEEQKKLDGTATATDKDDDSLIIDRGMLKTLLDSLGKESFEDLIKSYIEKADEIVAALVWLKQSPDIGVIRERSHELKGMAANFGIIEVSQIAGIIERAARNNDPGTALAEIERLPAANQRAKDAIAKVMA